MHVVAIVMWLFLAFGAISGLAFWIGERRRAIHERALREVLTEKNLMKPGESLGEALARMRPISTRPRPISTRPRPISTRPASAPPRKGSPPLPTFSSPALHREGSR